MDLTTEFIIKIQKKAKLVANKSGYSECADDFAQEVILKYIEGHAQHQTINQSFKDFLRRHYGDTTTISGKLKSIALRSMVQLEEARDIGSESAIERKSGNYSFLFRGHELEIYQRYFLYEQKELEIGRELNLTKSRISQILKEIKSKLETQLVYNNGKERMEWDDNYLVFKIDWLSM